MSNRSQSNLSALSLFNRGVAIELHASGIMQCIIQDTAFNNSTMLNDTLADIGESKSFSRKIVADIVGFLKALVLDCRNVATNLEKPASKKDAEKLDAMHAAFKPFIDAYIVTIAPIVDKQPTVKTEEQKAIDKAASKVKADEKAATWAKDNGWISPDQVETVQIAVVQSEEYQRLQKLLDMAREETASISEKLADSMRKLSTLHGENAMLRGNIETLSASNNEMVDKLSRIVALPKVSKAVLSIAA
jgi:(p)ppGpp synthase/HD superfamily hydrolase